jgi:hypothetical protein
MAGHLIATSGRDPAAVTIDAYLGELRRRLVGPARWRRKILAELEDGLLESLAANTRLGMKPEEAARRTISEFGSPELVAGAFAKDLADARVRRTALTLVRTGPLVGVLWLGAIASNHLAHPKLEGPWLALPLVGVGVAVCVPAAMVTLAATGRLGYRLPRLRAMAATAAATSALAAVAVDLVILGMAIAVVITSSQTRAWGLTAVATFASLTRLLLAGRAARWCMAARTELG